MPTLIPFRVAALASAFAVIVLTGAQISAASALRFPGQANSSVYKIGDPGVKAPEVRHEVKPQYTATAKKRKVKGSVELDEIVKSDGTVGDVRVVKSLDPELDRQAVRAARQWQFTPATKDGQPVNVRVRVEMTFTLK